MDQELAQTDADSKGSVEQPATESRRKKLNLDWTESEWFRVWLRLARGEEDSQ